MIPDALIHLEAEQSALGAALVGGVEALETLLRETTLDCFTLSEHRTLYRALRAMAETGTPAEIGLIRETYRRLELGAMPGDLLADLVDAVPTAANLAHWTAVLRDRADRRQAYTTLHQHAERAADLQTPLSETAAAATVALATTARPARPTLQRLLIEAMQQVEDEGKHGTAPGWPTGLTRVDGLTRGWQKGQLTLVAARPSVGKTQFAGFCVREILNAEEPVLFVTAEMSPLQLTRRLLALEAGVDLLRMQDRDWPQLARAVGAMAHWRLTLDGHSTTPGMIRLEAERVKRTEGSLALIAVDYVQLFHGDGRAENRNLDVGAVGRGLQRLALDLDVPVLALSQLSRDVEKGGTPRKPRLSDLRDSGELEQAADLVAFLHAREDEDDVIHGRRRVDFLLAKNRHGRKGDVPLTVNGCGRWTETEWQPQRVVA